MSDAPGWGLLVTAFFNFSKGTLIAHILTSGYFFMNSGPSLRFFQSRSLVWMNIVATFRKLVKCLMLISRVYWHFFPTYEIFCFAFLCYEHANIHLKMTKEASWVIVMWLGFLSFKTTKSQIIGFFVILTVLLLS